MFLLLLVLARWAQVHGNGCGSGILSQAGSKMPEPTALFQSPIEDILSCFRTGLSVARRSQPSPVRKGCKTRNYCMHKLGGWDDQYFSYKRVFSGFGFVENAQ